jgi:hypothetical protein
MDGYGRDAIGGRGAPQIKYTTNEPTTEYTSPVVLLKMRNAT